MGLFRVLFIEKSAGVSRAVQDPNDDELRVIKGVVHCIGTIEVDAQTREEVIATRSHLRSLTERLET